MNILGIHDGHNSSVALYQDGRIVYAVEEERFIREKNQTGFPIKAIAHCLRTFGLTLNDLEAIAFATTANDPFWASAYFNKFTVKDHIEEQYQYWQPVLYENKKSNYFNEKIKENLKDKILLKHLNEYFQYASGRDYSLRNEEIIRFYQSIRKKQFFEFIGQHNNIIFLDHHLCHAAHAYWAAPYSVRNNTNALILTLDAFGDGFNCLVSQINASGDIEPLKIYSKLNIARFYKYCTLLLGMKPLEHEYKVMGLAPYCTNETKIKGIFDIYKSALWIDDSLELISETQPKDSYFYFRQAFESYRFDEIAAGMQLYFESFITRMIDLLLKNYKKNTLFFGGGAAMNVKANMEIGKLNSLKNIYISPSPGDESLSIGACLHTALKKDKGFDPARELFPSIYGGYEITDDECTQSVARYFQSSAKYRIYANVTPTEIAELMAQNLVIARAAGKMEFGARALGNRSILANPISYNIVRKVNEKIKLRDFWMPFAPVILKEYQHRYVQNPKGFLSPYMMMAFPTTEEGKGSLQAGKHPYDDTVRPQFLTTDENPAYYDLVSEFGKLTGVYALLNTSFNLHGFPIVCTAEDAANVFLQTDLDGLILNDYLIVKSKCLPK